MDIFLTHTSSLALLRAARRADDLELRPSDVTVCAKSCPHGTAFEQVLAFLRPRIGQPSDTSRLEVVTSEAKLRSKDPLICNHVRQHAVPAGSYLEVVSVSPPKVQRLAQDKTTDEEEPPEESPPTIPADVRIYVEGAALALVTLASSLGRFVRTGRMERWLAVDRVIILAEELCGTYARDPLDPAGGTCAYGVARLANRDEIEEGLKIMTALPGSRLALRAIPYVEDESASPMETLHYMMESLPPRLSGLSIGRPKLNHRLDPGAKQRRVLSVKQGIRPDLYWEDYKIAVEHDGKEGHSTDRAWRSDRERVQDYQVFGVRVFPATHEDVRNVASLNSFAGKLCVAIAAAGKPSVGKHVRALVNDSAFRARQRELLALLLPPVDDPE